MLVRVMFGLRRARCAGLVALETFVARLIHDVMPHAGIRQFVRNRHAGNLQNERYATDIKIEHMQIA